MSRDMDLVHSSKTCQVCGRTCSAEAMQCPACRSAEFVGQASRIQAYKAAQKEKSRISRLQETEEQIEELSGTRFLHSRLLTIGAMGLVASGFVLPGWLGTAAFLVGGLGLGASVVLDRVRLGIECLRKEAQRLRSK